MGGKSLRRHHPSAFCTVQKVSDLPFWSVAGCNHSPRGLSWPQVLRFHRHHTPPSTHQACRPFLFYSGPKRWPYGLSDPSRAESCQQNLGPAYNVDLVQGMDKIEDDMRNKIVSMCIYQFRATNTKSIRTCNVVENNVGAMRHRDTSAGA